MSARDRRGLPRSALAQERFGIAHRATPVAATSLGLSGIVRGPILRVGLACDFHCLSDNRLTVCGLFALNHVLNSENMLASHLCEFVIGARAIEESDLG